MEREDSNKEVREKKEGGEKTPTDSFFLLFTDFYYYFDWIKILSFVLFILFLTFGLKMFFYLFDQ